VQLGGAFHFSLNFTEVGQATDNHGGLVFFDLDFLKARRTKDTPLDFSISVM
jgi:hypothetical protein